MNSKQWAAVATYTVAILASAAFPPWVGVGDDYGGELHYTPLGYAPLWAPPVMDSRLPVRGVREFQPDAYRLLRNLALGWILLGATGWILRDRRL